MWQDEVSHLTLDETIWWGGEEEREGKRKRKDREEEGSEGSSTFSLIFPTIGPSVSVGARGKVRPRGKSFDQRPESGSFDKL